MKMYKDDTDENEEESFDEYTTRDQPVVKSFYDKYGHDERDGPPESEEDEEERKPWGKWDSRRW